MIANGWCLTQLQNVRWALSVGFAIAVQAHVIGSPF